MTEARINEIAMKHTFSSCSVTEAIVAGIKEALQEEITGISNNDNLCICTTECLGAYHKDRKCKKLKGHNS